MPSTSEQNLCAILQERLIPQWDRFGMERLAVTTPTLAQFKKQSLPPLVSTSTKKRKGKRVNTGSKRLYGNTSRSVGSWPEDRQEALRFPCLVYTLKGQADLHVADYMVHLPEGHFLLQAPGIAHPDGSQPHLEGKNRSDGYCELLWFLAPPGTNSVSSFVCFSQGNRHWSRQEFDFCVVQHPEVVRFFNFFMREMLEKPHYYQKTAPRVLSNFFLLFKRELQAGRFFKSGESSQDVSFSIQHSPINEALQYIKNHLNQPLTTSLVARQVFMSRNAFMQHFAAVTGQTFHQYLIAQRMEAAKRLLQEGDWSLELICQFVGLHPTQFRYQFKKYFGVSPSAFKRQLEK